jgi:hypothetical protein
MYEVLEGRGCSPVSHAEPTKYHSTQDFLSSHPPPFPSTTPALSLPTTCFQTHKMCPHETSDTPNDEMVAIDMSGTTAVNGVNSEAPNGSEKVLNGHSVNGKDGHAQPKQERARHNPYAPRASDFLNNISNFSIIESTLRGEPTHDLVSL